MDGLSLADGYIAISNFEPMVRYDVAIGASYTGATSYETGKPVPEPVNGVSTLVENISRTGDIQQFVIRLYSPSGCYVEKQIRLTAVECTCPAIGVCVPTVIKKTKSESSAGQ